MIDLILVKHAKNVALNVLPTSKPDAGRHNAKLLNISS